MPAPWTVTNAAFANGEHLVTDDPKNVDLQGGLMRVQVAIGDILSLQGSVSKATENYRRGLSRMDDLATARAVDLSGSRQ